MRWMLVLLLGCDQGRKPPPVVLAPVPKDDVLDKLAADEVPPRVCFAASKDQRQLACLDQQDDQQDRYSGHRSIQLLRDGGDVEWNYLGGTEEPIATVRDAIDHSVIEEVRAAFVQRGFVPFVAKGPLLEHTARVGAFTLRRDRKITNPAVEGNPDAQPGDPDFSEGSWNTYADAVALACGSRWVPIDLDGLNIRYGEVEMRVSPLGDHELLLEVAGSWGIEGESGTTRGAKVLDVTTLCR